MNKNKGYLTIISAIFFIALLGFQATVGLFDGSSAKNIKQGLDLAGGVSITYEVVEGQNPSDKDLSDTKNKLEKRVQQYSLEAVVYQEGNNRFNIEIPGETDATKILSELGKPGSLYFLSQTNSKGELNYQQVGFSETGELQFELLKTIEEIEKEGSIVIYGTDVKAADAVSFPDQQTNQTTYGVSLSLTDEGKQKFATATTKAASQNETIAIYYDGEFVSVPGVDNPIMDGNAQISGDFLPEEAENLASTIRIGGLSVELQEIYNKVVGAQLGGTALSTSITAGLIGLAMVLLFMIVVYFLPGVAAGLGLLIYVPFIIVLIDGFDMTLTLPGVAGIILSIGMAVDANVIIFARIREELATGKTVKSSIKIGFDKAFSAIIDGNVTTLIAALVLMVMGSGVVKGFAQTLMLGICLSMFTSLLVTRLLVYAFYAIGFTNEKWYGIGKQVKVFDFIGKRKIFFAISGVLIIGGFAMLGINQAQKGKMLNYGLEFEGGTSTSVVFNEANSLEVVDNEITPIIEKAIGGGVVQPQMIDGTNEVIFKTKTLEVEQRDALAKALVDNYKIDKELITSETISSTISGETRQETILAVIVAVIFMLIYIKFRFTDIRFGLSSVVALVHDVLVVLAFYAVAQITVGNTFIACMLTIVGYSINATIVIFDRIRENIELEGTKTDLKTIINNSTAQTLSRSVFTSFTTLIMVVVLYIMGVTSIREFALPLIVGIICGTYSSICLAGGFWYVFKVKFPSKVKKENK